MFDLTVTVGIETITLSHDYGTFTALTDCTHDSVKWSSPQNKYPPVEVKKVTMDGSGLVTFDWEPFKIEAKNGDKKSDQCLTDPHLTL